MTRQHNILWAVLAKGVPFGDPVASRQFDTGLYAPNATMAAVIDILVPSSDTLLRAFYIEQVVTLLRSSALRSEADVTDPINTYQHPLVFPDPGYTTGTLPADLQLYVRADQALLKSTTQGRIDATCTVDPIGMDVTHPYGVSSYIVTSGLTSMIGILPGLSFQMGGVIPGAPFDIHLEVIAERAVAWSRLLRSLESATLEWQDTGLRDIWNSSSLWPERIAAVTLSAVRQCQNLNL